MEATPHLRDEVDDPNRWRRPLRHPIGVALGGGRNVSLTIVFAQIPPMVPRESRTCVARSWSIRAAAASSGSRWAWAEMMAAATAPRDTPALQCTYTLLPATKLASHTGNTSRM